jgi:hypothetical protein
MGEEKLEKGTEESLGIENRGTVGQKTDSLTWSLV